MNKDELWNHFLKRNPSLDSDNPTFTRDNLKKFFDATFQEGCSHGQMQERAMRDMRDAVNKGYKSPFGDMFDFLKKKP